MAKLLEFLKAQPRALSYTEIQKHYGEAGPELLKLVDEGKVKKIQRGEIVTYLAL